MVDLSDALVEAADLLTEADRLYRAAEAHQQACARHMGNMRELWEMEWARRQEEFEWRQDNEGYR